MSKFKKADIVQNEWREEYDRELDTGVIVEVKPDNNYLVARIGKDKDGWYFTGQEATRPESFLTPIDIAFEDTGLQL